MPCPYTGSKMFFAGPNVLRQSKNLIAFSVSSKTFVSILLNANHLLVWHKKIRSDFIMGYFDTLPSLVSLIEVAAWLL